MLTEENDKDKLRMYINLSNTELTEILLEIANIMSSRKVCMEESPVEEIDVKTLPETEMLWHCYLCGHYWSGYDKTNPDPPDRCPKCGKADYRRAKWIGYHDPSCKRCKKKLGKILELSEELQARIKQIQS